MLQFHHIPRKMQNIISELYSGFSTSIATKKIVTSPLQVEIGVLQGDCLSPLLFNPIKPGLLALELTLGGGVFHPPSITPLSLKLDCSNFAQSSFQKG